MRWQARLVRSRTTLTGLDPGLERLRLAAIGMASVVLAVAVMSGVRALTGQPVTVVLFAAVLAMISNLAVNESDLGRRRVTTLLMLTPAVASIATGTLLAPHRVVADVVFVVVMVIAVYVRRFGPRGFALGMAAFMPFFFTQFLQATADQLPWLLVGAVTGIGSTLLLRGQVFAERPERTLQRLVRAFRAHLNGLIEAVADLLAAPPQAVEDKLRKVRRRRTRLNQTALLVAEGVEQRDADHGTDEREGHGTDLALRILDAELAAERLAVATCRLVQSDTPMNDGSRRALLAGLHSLEAASATGTPPEMVTTLLDGAKRSVNTLVTESREHSDRTHRAAFAVTRLADAMGTAQRPDGPSPADGRAAQTLTDRTGRGPDPEDRPGSPDEDGDRDPQRDGETNTGANTAGPPGLRLSTRQAVQVGVATSLAIVVGELVSPSRWYWAVITAFVVFAGTSSSGDVLSRGWRRVVGTIGGVIAGMGLAVLVGGHPLPALLLLFGCVFLALYLVRSQALMAFWITAVLALLYGLIGQFSIETLVVRIEETAIGATIGILAGYLVLPKRTREAFGEALEEMVDAADAVLAAAVERILGRQPDTPPVQLARQMGNTLDTLRQRAKPLPRHGGRSSYQRALRVLTSVDHYARSLARLSDGVREPGWAPTLNPAVDRVRANLNVLHQVLLHRETGEIRSAEDVIDAAEADAMRTAHPHRRADLLSATQQLRRIDQAVVGFATDIQQPDETTVHHASVPGQRR